MHKLSVLLITFLRSQVWYILEIIFIILMLLSHILFIPENSLIILINPFNRFIFNEFYNKNIIEKF